MAYKSKKKWKEYQKDWHIKHKRERIIAIKKAELIRIKKYYKKLLKIFGDKCTECGFSDTKILEWHHIEKRAKDENCISSLLSRGMGWKKIFEEAKKCKLLCPNCHRYKHYKKPKYVNE